jgi:hypothetical protein
MQACASNICRFRELGWAPALPEPFCMDHCPLTDLLLLLLLLARRKLDNPKRGALSGVLG